MATDQEKLRETRQWLESWYSVADKCVPTNSIKFFAQRCTVRFNNAPAVQGKSHAQQEFESIAPIIEWMRHDIVDIDIIGDKIYNECIVTYVLKGDAERKEITMHRMNHYERVPKGQPEEGQILQWTAYFDSSPMRERMAAIKPGQRVY